MVLRITVTPSGKAPPTADDDQETPNLLPATADTPLVPGAPNAPTAPALPIQGRPSPPVVAPIQRQPEDDSFQGGDDLEPALKRRSDENLQLQKFGNVVRPITNDFGSLFISMAEAGTLSGNDVAEQAAERARARQAWMDATAKGAQAAVGDVGRGIIEAPRQVIGGARDAMQAAINGLGAVGDWMNAHVGDLGTLQLLDEQGNLAPALKPSAAKSEMPQLPEVKKPESVTGGIVRGISQFLTGFVGAGKALGAAAPGGFAGAAAKGALSDFSAFEAHEERLSNLVQQFPALQNPVTEFMAAKEGENEAVGRFKRAVEGLGLGIAAEGLLRGLAAVKAARLARQAEGEGETVKAAATAKAVEREAAPLDMLGDPAAEAPLTARPGDKLRLAEAVISDTGVPEAVTAGSLTEKGFTPLDAKRDVFINWARINSPTDVKQVMQDVADAFKGTVDEARRGKRSNKQTVESAAKLDAWDIVEGRRKGEPLNAEESFAARQLWEASGQKLMEVAKAAAENPRPENLYQFRKMLATHYAIQADVIAARTETARALQSWAIPAGGSKEQMRAIEEMVSRYGGMDVNGDLAARVAALKDLPNGLAALDQIAEKGLLAKSLDVVKEIWINALLSGPKTHMVNTVSNTAVAGQQIVEGFVASRYSQIFGSGQVPIGDAMAAWHGVMQGWRDAFANAAASFRTGQSGFGLGKVELPRDRALSAGNFGMPEESWIGRAIDGLGTIVSLPGRALTTADEFYKTIGYRMELHRQAFRTASQEALDGKISNAEIKSRMAGIVANPPESVRLQSVDAATYQTFTQEPGSWVQAINRLEHDLGNRGPAGQLGATLMRFLIPFRNTPANIMKYTFERTPLAPLMERYRDAIAQGGAQADIARTRMALGTATMLLATDLAMDGHLTGSGPAKNERGERDALYRSGWQPYSVKSGGRYFSYSRMDPIGFTLGLGADMGEYLREADFSDSTGVEIQKAFTAGAMSVGSNVLSKSYVRGVADFMSALMGSDAQGSSYLEKMAGSFMPTGTAEVARVIDPYMRATHDIMSRLRSRTPGLSQDLPVQRDLYGRPKTYQSGLGATYDAVSPIYSRREEIQPIDREMMQQSWYLNMPARKVSGVSLSGKPEVYSRYLQLQGSTPASELGDRRLLQRYGDHTQLETLNGLVTGAHPLSDQYLDLEHDDDREKFVRKIVNAYRAAARTKLKEEFPKVFEEKDKGDD